MDIKAAREPWSSPARRRPSVAILGLLTALSVACHPTSTETGNYNRGYQEIGEAMLLAEAYFDSHNSFVGFAEDVLKRVPESGVDWHVPTEEVVAVRGQYVISESANVAVVAVTMPGGKYLCATIQNETAATVSRFLVEYGSGVGLPTSASDCRDMDLSNPYA